ncbi:MAG: hypothetical protein EAZ19_23035 [Oscillatoriales cyanobacterium]|nr:MAG: hypothetical protein EAZ28_32455 [Oscillatoriales cyanobacterium]TAG90158.1 MAG: hypothetical protein EAZ19_23035 [Oscillatoriales cyanobacterium]
MEILAELNFKSPLPLSKIYPGSRAKSIGNSSFLGRIFQKKRSIALTNCSLDLLYKFLSNTKTADLKQIDAD